MAGSSRTLRIARALTVVLLLAIVGVLGFLQVGKWLVVQDPLEPADAIVVLSGQ